LTAREGPKSRVDKIELRPEQRRHPNKQIPMLPPLFFGGPNSLSVPCSYYLGVVIQLSPFGDTDKIARPHFPPGLAAPRKACDAVWTPSGRETIQ